jgi:hypothetical protein
MFLLASCIIVPTAKLIFSEWEKNPAHAGSKQVLWSVNLVHFSFLELTQFPPQAGAKNAAWCTSPLETDTREK